MLETVSLFADLSDSEIIEIEKISQRMKLGSDETVFHEGEFSRDIYIIESGEVQIMVRDLSGVTKIVTTLRSKDFFGEMALLDNSIPRLATFTVPHNLGA